MRTETRSGTIAASLQLCHHLTKPPSTLLAADWAWMAFNRLLMEQAGAMSYHENAEASPAIDANLDRRFSFSPTPCRDKNPDHGCSSTPCYDPSVKHRSSLGQEQKRARASDEARAPSQLDNPRVLQGSHAARRMVDGR